MPIICSVDPTTGNLAVVNLEPGYNSGNNIAIYTGAQGYPTLYRDGDMKQYSGCAYDNNGNLFVEGRNEDYVPQLIELPEGSGPFTTISLSRRLGDEAIPGVIQWRGGYLTVAFNAGRIYSVKVSGTTGKVIKTTHLVGAANNSQPWTLGNSQRPHTSPWFTTGTRLTRSRFTLFRRAASHQALSTLGCPSMLGSTTLRSTSSRPPAPADNGLGDVHP
jgi:hypothetical protein